MDGAKNWIIRIREQPGSFHDLVNRRSTSPIGQSTRTI